jgi:predicted GNAT family acetyltransferase
MNLFKRKYIYYIKSINKSFSRGKNKMLKLTNKNEVYMLKYGLITPNARTIEYNNELVGFINYIESENKITILYITIQDEHKGKGIATQLIDMLREKKKEIHGDATPTAIPFWNKFNPVWIKEDEEDEEYLIHFIIRQ